MSILKDIERDTGKNTFSGTDIQAGILNNLECFFGLSAYKAYDAIVLVTDGDLSRVKFNETELLMNLQNNGVRLYCIDIGSSVESMLERLCLKSGGRYYTYDNVEYDIMDSFLQELNKDVDNITEGYTYGGLTSEDLKIIEADVLRTGTGLKIFEDVDLGLLESSEDIDGDGLNNGEELKVMTNNGHTYYYLVSNPFVKDTDGDGINDDDDTAPFMYGMKGGIVGKLYIGAHPNDYIMLLLATIPAKALWHIFNKNVLPLDVGHSWLVYNSYVDRVLDSEAIYAGYIPIKVGKKLMYISSHNLYPYTLEAGTSVSFGHYPYEPSSSEDSPTKWDENMSEEEIAMIIKQGEMLKAEYKDAGYLYDSLFSDFRLNQEFFNLNEYGTTTYNKDVAKEVEITEGQLKSLLNYIDEDKEYTYITYNCTDFAVEGWNSVVPCSKHTIHYSTVGFATPRGVYAELKHGQHIDNITEIMQGLMLAIKGKLYLDEDYNVRDIDEVGLDE